MTEQEWKSEIERRDEIIASYKSLSAKGSWMTNTAKLFYTLLTLLIGLSLGFLVATIIKAGW